MIKPTVGRVVWFHVDKGVEPLAAIICYVWHDRMVNLAVFDTNGRHLTHTSVTLLQDDDRKPEGCFASWMPFQKGQAAKTEALENLAKGTAIDPGAAA